MKSPIPLKLPALLGVSLVVLLAYGTSSYAESLGDEAAKAALARKAAMDAEAVGYRINGDGTVTDIQRGLMWKQCSEEQSGSGCSGTAAKYTWDDAMSRFGSGVSFAGYSDWRMPTKDELKSLVYCSNGTPQATAWDKDCSNDGKAGDYQRSTINQQVFPNTLSSRYWSSTAKDASFACFVLFDSGNCYWDSRNADYAVRLVRSGQ